VPFYAHCSEEEHCRFLLKNALRRFSCLNGSRTVLESDAERLVATRIRYLHDFNVKSLSNQDFLPLSIDKREMLAGPLYEIIGDANNTDEKVIDTILTIIKKLDDFKN
jgi:hypothetical protein